jgi:hypothetical protein
MERPLYSTENRRIGAEDYIENSRIRARNPSIGKLGDLQLEGEKTIDAKRVRHAFLKFLEMPTRYMIAILIPAEAKRVPVLALRTGCVPWPALQS